MTKKAPQIKVLSISLHQMPLELSDKIRKPLHCKITKTNRTEKVTKNYNMYTFWAYGYMQYIWMQGMDNSD